MMTAIELIAAERERQKTVEGWTPEHDDEHDGEELAMAAAAYASGDPGTLWPWAPEWWKPSPEDRIRELVKAGALIVAEIERLQRAEAAIDAMAERMKRTGGYGREER